MNIGETHNWMKKILHQGNLGTLVEEYEIDLMDSGPKIPILVIEWYVKWPRLDFFSRQFVTFVDAKLLSDSLLKRLDNERGKKEVHGLVIYGGMIAESLNDEVAKYPEIQLLSNEELIL